MFLILNSENIIVEYCKYSCYTIKQSNGIVTLSDQANADSIYSSDSDSFYPVVWTSYSEDIYHLIEVDSVPEDINDKKYKYENGEFVIAPPVITNNDLLSRIENVENGLLDLMEGQVDTFELILGGI